jgi:hypothetical protein
MQPMRLLFVEGINQRNKFQLDGTQYESSLMLGNSQLFNRGLLKMKINIKTLQQTQFSLEVAPQDNVLYSANIKVLKVKDKIQTAQGHAPSDQKLIYKGYLLAHY